VRDSLLVLELLENPPRLNRMMKAAIAALPKRRLSAASNQAACQLSMKKGRHC
jgi:hypothetical protein